MTAGKRIPRSGVCVHSGVLRVSQGILDGPVEDSIAANPANRWGRLVPLPLAGPERGTTQRVVGIDRDAVWH